MSSKWQYFKICSHILIDLSNYHNTRPSIWLPYVFVQAIFPYIRREQKLLRKHAQSLSSRPCLVFFVLFWQITSTEDPTQRRFTSTTLSICCLMSLVVWVICGPFFRPLYSAYQMIVTKRNSCIFLGKMHELSQKSGFQNSITKCLIRVFPKHIYSWVCKLSSLRIS